MLTRIITAFNHHYNVNISTRVAQIYYTVKKSLKFLPAHMVSHYIGPCDYKMPKIKIWNAWFGLPQGLQSLCNSVCSKKISASQNQPINGLFFGCEYKSGSNIKGHIIIYHVNKKIWNFINIWPRYSLTEYPNPQHHNHWLKISIFSKFLFHMKV